MLKTSHVDQHRFKYEKKRLPDDDGLCADWVPRITYSE
jgi:hypothetical protein